jgi:dihydropteroate synthase
MGIVNVTPDSFFPDSRSSSVAEAVARGRTLFDVGCDIVDVGGESTRPRATAVSVDEELTRVVPVVEALSALGPVSVDTQKEEVARAAVAAGACVVNDVSCTLLNVAGELGVGYVAMHRQGDSRTMQDNPTYDDVVGEIEAFLDGVAARARTATIRQLWLDPGIGFGKTLEHNLTLLAHTDRFAALAQHYGAGLLIGTSRKQFLSRLGVHELGVEERLEGSIASAAWAMLQGATMVRVHDAEAAVQLRELLVCPVGEVVA